MPRGRRRKIEVPRDTQPRFELGDTAEDIERRGEREERDERERREQEERERQRIERERREDSKKRTEKRPQTDTDTDVKSIQSRQKGQIKSIFLSDSDKEAIMEFIKQHKEHYDKTNDKFKDKKKERKHLPGNYLSTLSRSGLRLNVPDIVSSLRQSQDKQLRRAQNDRPGCFSFL